MKITRSRRQLALVLISTLIIGGFGVNPGLSTHSESLRSKLRPAAPLTVFTVTNTDNSGPGSLRQAVADAIAGGGGTITFSSLFNTPQTINLSTGGFSITT